MKLRTFALTMAVSLTTAISAQTATLVVNGGGELTGATDVAVLGSVYNVEFVDGTCFSLFNGCDAVSDFDFITEADARSASQALLDQVFLGQFDDDPSLTRGISSAFSGRAITPYGFFPSGPARAAASENALVEAGDFVFIGSISIFGDTSDSSPATWARWTFTGDIIPAVPLPAGGLLLLSGLAGLAAHKRRKKRAAL